MPAQERESKRALVIDDQELVRRVLLRSLNTRGWEVLCAPTAREAIEKFQEGDWSLVISDVNLGGAPEDGIALAKELRRQKPRLRIIIMSGDTEAKTSAAEAGFLEFLSKPHMLEELQALLGE